MGRIEKVNQSIKREIGNIVLMEMKDPRLEFVTITHVEVSKDLQHSKVYFSVLGTNVQVKKAQEALDNARGFIRKLIGERIRMRYTPEFQFIFDKSIEYGARIETTLEEINNELRKNTKNN